MSEALRHIVDFIRNCPPFSDLEEAELSLIANQLEVQYRRKSSKAKDGVTESDLNRDLLIIRKGAIQLHSQSGDLLDIRQEGSSLYLPRIKAEHGDNIELSYLEDTLLYALPEETFTRLRKSNRSFDRFFHADKTKRLRRSGASPFNSNPVLRPVSSVMSAKVYSVSSNTSIRDAASAMTDHKVSSIPVIDNHKLVGILTDRDLRSRVVARGIDAAKPISSVMTEAPLSIEPSSSILDATLTMTQAKVHHLPVVEGDEVIGILTASDLMLAKQNDPIYVVQHIKRQNDAESIAQLTHTLPTLFSDWIHSGVKAKHLSKILTSISDAVCRRLIELSIEKLGPAPVPFAWLGFGSQGRFEQMLNADQDNGLIIDNSAKAEDLAWFEQMTKEVCKGLDTSGYIFCPGDVMASNAKWRLSLDEWRSTVNRWVAAPTPKATMLVSIFFDIRCVYGDAKLAQQLQAHMLAKSSNNSIFLASLAKNVLDTPPPLGLFRRFLVERNGEHKDKLNIKKSGILPIVECLRLYALANNVSEINSFDRIEALQKRGVLRLSEARNLSDAFAFILQLRCEHQAEQIAGGDAPDNYIHPGNVSSVFKHQLKDAFDVIEDNHQSIKLRYRAGLD